MLQDLLLQAPRRKGDLPGALSLRIGSKAEATTKMQKGRKRTRSDRRSAASLSPILSNGRGPVSATKCVSSMANAGENK